MLSVSVSDLQELSHFQNDENDDQTLPDHPSEVFWHTCRLA